MTSDEARELFSDYVENTLDPPTRDAMQAFLSAHPDGAAELFAFERTLSLIHRLPPREPSLDLWREFAPRMAAHGADLAATRTVGVWQRVRYNGRQMLAQLSAGLILWTHALASRTHARLERYLLHDPLPHFRRDDLRETGS